ncbi:MAG TPA: hypothetical protein DCQ93_05455 [Bacteroidetes bacterium]|nr:hypothetical protein [Bacteroidota bacterium]
MALVTENKIEIHTKGRINKFVIMENAAVFSKKQSLWALIPFISLTLIIFSSITLYFRYIRTDSANYGAINVYNQQLSSLRDMSQSGINIQRFSNNLLVYWGDSTEINWNQKKISDCRTQFSESINKYSLLDTSSSSIKDSLLALGNYFLYTNQTYLQKIAAKDSSNAYLYRIQVSRPIIEKFLTLNQTYSNTLSSQIATISSSNRSVYSHYEFWLLVAGILPFIVIYLIVAKSFLEIIIWEIIF